MSSLYCASFSFALPPRTPVIRCRSAEESTPSLGMAVLTRVRLFFVGGPETSRRGCEQQGKSYLTRRRRGEEGDGGGSLTGGAIPSA